MLRDKLLKMIHPVILKVVSKQRKLDLIVDGTIPSGQPFIFVSNHTCVHDVPLAAEIIGKHAYVLASAEDNQSVYGLAFSINGVVWVNRLDKASRSNARDRVLAHLKAGHNILMYPEATWNLSPNLPVLKMSWGVIDISQKSHVPIVPIYLLYSDERCHAKIGEPFYPDGSKEECIEELRGRMAALCWDLMESQPPCSRKDIPPDYSAVSIQKRFAEYGRTKNDIAGIVEHEKQFVFRPKGIINYEEAFAHLDQLIPCRANAFLFRKRASDPPAQGALYGTK